MKRWAELKEAFWGIVDRDPADRARQLEALASTDPDLHRQLEKLLAADARREPMLAGMIGAGTLDSHVTLAPGSRIGAYEIRGSLGVGGMGEVYRAHDSRLHREVAVKVLPRAVTSDRSRLLRFEQEAQTLAALNHPHIAQVYGFEESTGAPALVMELVEGPTLQQVIGSHSEKRIGITRALTIARQIADGLDAAHEKGIVHSDLKPSNIALTPAGDVKILDFGIARNMAAAAVLETSMTLVGAGTPAYMSPEQARGLPIDKRSDVWAFGCVLYELLTGHRPAISVTTADIPGATSHPDFSELPAETPATVRSLIRHCLEQDPRRRLRDIADARLIIDDVLDRPAGDPVSRVGDQEQIAQARRSLRRRVIAGIAVGAIMAAAVILAAVRVLDRGRSTAAEPVISSLMLPDGMRVGGNSIIAQSFDSWFALSPDGRRLAIAAADENGRQRLWVRELAYPVFRPLPETEDASFPFWSPNSDQIAFTAADRLKRISVSGGTPVTLAESAFRTGAWSRDGVILYAPTRSAALHQMPASGGESTTVTTLHAADGEVQHTYPAFLPDGRHFLYVGTGTRAGGANAVRGIYIGSLDSGQAPTLLLPGSTRALYVSGRLLFLRGGQLMAQDFDPTRLELRGNPTPLVEQVKTATSGATGVTGTFSASDTGMLVYQTQFPITSQPLWFDRTGVQVAKIGAVGRYGDVALSPDGARLAISVADAAVGTMDLWVYDTKSGGGQRLTSDRTDEFAPVWSPDGDRVLFSVLNKGAVDLFIKDANGTGAATPLQVDSLGLGRFAADWSRDGRFIAYVGGGRAIGRSELWIAPMSAPRDARVLVTSTFRQTHPRLAPQGGWFAFASDESGRLEVYADRFPDRGARRLISSGGGAWPRWARNGSEIYYLSPDNQLMAVPVRTTAHGIDVGTPRRLFATRPRPAMRLDAYSYDVSPDGRFIVNTVVEQTADNAITLLSNWTSALDGN